MGTKGLPRNWNASMHRPAEVPASSYLSRCNALQLIQAAVVGFIKSQIVFCKMLPPGSPAPVLRCQKWFHALGEKGTELGFQKIWNHVKTVDFLVQRERITGCYPADFSFCWTPDVCKRNTVRCTSFIFLHSAFLASSSLWHDCMFLYI